MNKNLQTVFHYHETTKHSQQRYAKSLGYMNWSTQPNPFREYKGSKSLLLPLALDNVTPPYHLLDSDLPCAPLLLESVSQLLQFSMGIAAHKESDGGSWAVRCNASSGNLHPTESYLILPPIKEQDKSTTLHYAPKNHSLETLSEFDTDFWSELPNGSFLVGISSITWREVWKYGERAFRYTNLDVGHAIQSFMVSANMLGWKTTQLDNISDDDLSTLLGLSQKNRFYEDEYPDTLLVISPEYISTSISIDTLIQDVPLVYDGIANKLSPSMHEWEIIPSIHKATKGKTLSQNNLQRLTIQKEPTQESKQVVLQRRSIHIMDKETSLITSSQFHNLLQSVYNSLNAKENSTHLVLFVHRVEEYDAGLYIYIRNDRDIDALKEEMHTDFMWERTSLDNLYLLEKRDLTMASKAISCSQDIASDGAFSLGMLSNFSQQLLDFGPHRYKELYWECGAIGQELYLEATSMGLSGTGIGCFLDDMMHSLLGIKTNKFQVLYHFTIGRGYVDSRIKTEPAYERTI